VSGHELFERDGLARESEQTVVGDRADDRGVVTEPREERVDVRRSDLNEQAAYRLREHPDRHIVVSGMVEASAESAGDAHLGCREREATLAQVMTSSDFSGEYRRVE
jgi:hypothetical protein